jgi:excisionase family DNA binding protein
MNKQEAAEFLSVSVRAVERYTQQGKLSVNYKPGRTRPVAEYREDELEVLREEINANLYHQRPAHEKVNPANPEQSVAVVGIQPQSLERRADRQSIVALVSAIQDALAANLAQGNGIPRTLSPADLAHKLTLSITEAAALSGLSANHLRDAIHEGKLKARIIGRGYKVKKEALADYVRKL